MIPKCLCAILCYNDGDVLEDVITHMLANQHDIVVFDHGSNYKTAQVLDRYPSIDRKLISRSVPFGQMFELLSQYILDNYRNYDWISWPDADEILEGPDRKKSYFEYVCEVYNSPCTHIQCNLYNYIFGEEDDMSVTSPTLRIRRYAIRPGTAPIFRGWKNSVTKVRHKNHEPLDGERYPVLFNLRHFALRSYPQLINRIYVTRAGIRRDDESHHYENLRRSLPCLNSLTAAQFHLDDGISELNPDPIFNWRVLYGYPPSSPHFGPWVSWHNKLKLQIRTSANMLTDPIQPDTPPPPPAGKSTGTSMKIVGRLLPIINRFLPPGSRRRSLASRVYNRFVK